MWRGRMDGDSGEEKRRKGVILGSQEEKSGRNEEAQENNGKVDEWTRYGQEGAKGRLFLF